MRWRLQLNLAWGEGGLRCVVGGLGTAAHTPLTPLTFQIEIKGHTTPVTNVQTPNVFPAVNCPINPSSGELSNANWPTPPNSLLGQWQTVGRPLAPGGALCAKVSAPCGKKGSEQEADKSPQ